MNIVFHQAALGDWVLVIGLIRGLAGRTDMVAGWSQARLAERLITGGCAVGIEHRDFGWLYQPGGHQQVSPERRAWFSGAELIVSFVGQGGVWESNVRVLEGSARVVMIDPKPPAGWKEHVSRWWEMQLNDRGVMLNPRAVPRRKISDGPVVVHPGSGGRDKCWTLAGYRRVIASLRAEGRRVRVLLGEVEAERWPGDELRAWIEGEQAEVLTSLDDLYEAVAGAELYVGNDSGPTHLAAQAGVPTVALFGPTDPVLWRPVGPVVYVLAPERPGPMSWLTAEEVIEACRRGLGVRV